jgi:hypothetical protein
VRVGRATRPFIQLTKWIAHRPPTPPTLCQLCAEPDIAFMRAAGLGCGRQIVEEYQGAMGAKMGKVIGRTLAELDGRFCSVRTGESNLGNLVCDIWQKATGAEAVLLNSGSLRSDMLHPAGEAVSWRAGAAAALCPQVAVSCSREGWGCILGRCLHWGPQRVMR